MSPERIAGRLPKDTDEAKASDLWSVGVIMYLLISGTPPFTGNNVEDVCDRITKGEFLFVGNEWNNLVEAKQLIDELMKFESGERIDASAALNHQFFRNLVMNQGSKEKEKKRELKTFDGFCDF